jgi:hypothetical protein
VYINQTVVHQAEIVKYLGLKFDKLLTWKSHVAMKHKELDLKTREIYWLIGKHSPLSLENKLLIYKTVLKPVWTYGIELWGCATKSNIAVIQRYQSKLLRTQPARQHGIPGTDSYSSHDPGLSPQPSHGTTSAPAKQQALKTKMDI